jgi:Na+/H+-dicarboxylate symporter
MTRLRLWIAIILGIPLGIIAGYAVGNAWGDSDYLGCSISCFMSSLQGPALGVVIAPSVIFLGLTIFWRPKPVYEAPTLDENPA